MRQAKPWLGKDLPKVVPGPVVQRTHGVALAALEEGPVQKAIVFLVADLRLDVSFRQACVNP